jgi:CheY-like chemotaxis protein
MPLLLILEDEQADLYIAADIARHVGFSGVQGTSFASDALRYLERAMAGEVALPDAMLVDLVLGIESGFELLRLWHSRPQLRSIPVIVWSAAGSREREICLLFGVHRFVAKAAGLGLLAESLAGLCRGSNSASQRTA